MSHNGTHYLEQRQRAFYTVITIRGYLEYVILIQYYKIKTLEEIEAADRFDTRPQASRASVKRFDAAGPHDALLDADDPVADHSD